MPVHLLRTLGASKRKTYTNASDQPLSQPFGLFKESAAVRHSQPSIIDLVHLSPRALESRPRLIHASLRAWRNAMQCISSPLAALQRMGMYGGGCCWYAKSDRWGDELESLSTTN